MKRGKAYQKAKETVPAEAVSVTEAITFVKTHGRKSFDEAVEVHCHLGINPEKSDQMVRGTVTLPGGTPKQKRVAVITADVEQQKEATAAGATVVGGEELIDQIASTGALEADITIATPAMMPKIAKVARVLGPKGLMPNPKTGTVTDDPAGAVKDLAGGKLSFKMDQLGNIHESVGRVSWDEEKLTANIQALIEAVEAARPAGAKGEFLRSITVATTMGPGIRVGI